VAGPYDDTPLFVHGQWLYQSLMIAVPKAEEIGANVDELVAFVRNGNALVIITDDRIVKEPYRQLADAFGLEIDYPTTVVKDQAKTIKEMDDGTYTTISVNSTSKIAQAENIIYRGIGHQIRKNKNKAYVVSKILQGNPTTVTMRAEKKRRRRKKSDRIRKQRAYGEHSADAKQWKIHINRKRIHGE